MNKVILHIEKIELIFRVKIIIVSKIYYYWLNNIVKNTYFAASIRVAQVRSTTIMTTSNVDTAAGVVSTSLDKVKILTLTRFTVTEEQVFFFFRQNHNNNNYFC